MRYVKMKIATEAPAAANWVPCWGILYVFATPSGSHVTGVAYDPRLMNRAQPPWEPLSLSIVQSLQSAVEKGTGRAKDALVPIMLRVVWCDVPPDN